LDNAQRLYARPGKTSPQKNGFDQRTWRGDDNLMLRASFTAFEACYVLSEAEVGRAWAAVFTARPTAEELYDWLTSLK